MMDRKSFYYRAMIILVFMAVALLWVFTASFHLQDKAQIRSGNAPGLVDSDHELTQTFAAVSENLSRVEVVVNKEDPDAGGTLKIQIYSFEGDQPDGSPVLGEVIGEDSLDLGSFDYLGGQRLDFDQIVTSPGDVYAMRFTIEGNGDASIRLMGFDEDVYGDGRAYQDGMPLEGDIYFVLYHRTDIEGLLDKIAPFHPVPLGSAVLFVALFIIGAGSFGWLLSEIIDPVKSKGEAVAGEKQEG